MYIRYIHLSNRSRFITDTLQHRLKKKLSIFDSTLKMKVREREGEEKEKGEGWKNGGKMFV